MALSTFMKSLGCTMTNRVWSWCAMSSERSRAIFTVWEDQLEAGRYVFWPKQDVFWKKKLGGQELLTVLRASLDRSYQTLGIICRAQDVGAEPRKRKDYDDQRLAVLTLNEEEDGIVGYVSGYISAQDVISGSFSAPREDNDISGPDAWDLFDEMLDREDEKNPVRRERSTTAYLRSRAVRDFVLKRANGQCEYCHHPGFPTAEGRSYLETHHICALSEQGPDTIRNIIALCAEHHREAHFGARANELRLEFEEALKKLNGASSGPSRP